MRNNDNPSDQRHAACLVLLISVCLAALGGCAAERAVREQRLIREHLVDLYEDQIRDNLVRIKTGRAFVHVNYSKLQGKTRDQVFGKIQAGNQNTEVAGDNNIIIEGPGRNDITVVGEVTLGDEISVSGEPVIGNATVYDAYILFAEQFVKKHSAEDESEHLWEYTYKKEDGTSVTYCVPIPKQETNGKANGPKKAYERLIWLTTLDQGKTAKVKAIYALEVCSKPFKVLGDWCLHGLTLFPDPVESSKTFVSGLLFLPSDNQYYHVINHHKAGLTLLLRKGKPKPKLGKAIAILEYREKPKDPPKKAKLTIHGYGLTFTPN
ncbi:MAG: hypothetical protein V3T84_15795 [Phycisphaerales bacterium]